MGGGSHKVIEMSTITPLTSVEDLIRIPNDGVRRELYAGELVTMALAGLDDGAFSSEIAFRLNLHVKTHQLGRVVGTDVGFLLRQHPDTLVAPDVAFIRTERLTSIKKRNGYCIGPPDLAVEVISLSDRVSEVANKAKLYLDSGTIEVWIVNPRDRTISVYESGVETLKLTNNEILKERKLRAGFECLVSDLLGEPF